jgi:O-acetylhomoserine (thiol)-lyase
LSDEEQRAAGVTPDFVRLSVGIASIDDVPADLERALAKVRVGSIHELGVHFGGEGRGG